MQEGQGHIQVQGQGSMKMLVCKHQVEQGGGDSVPKMQKVKVICTWACNVKFRHKQAGQNIYDKISHTWVCKSIVIRKHAKVRFNRASW